MAAWLGGGVWRELIHVYVCMSESFCCPPETLTLLITCTPIKNEKLKILIHVTNGRTLKTLLSEKKPSTYCMILFIWKIQNRKICRDRQCGLAVARGWGRREWGGMLTGMGFLLGWLKCSGNKQWWCLHHIVNVLHATELIKMIHFILYIFYYS